MSSPQPNLSPETLAKHLIYCEDTGAIALNPAAPHPRIKKYLTDCIWVDGHNYTFPRLAFYMHNGYLPKRLVKIGDDFDMRVENFKPHTPIPRIIKPREPKQLLAGLPSAPTAPKRRSSEVMATLKANKVKKDRITAEAILAKRRERNRANYEAKLAREGKQLHPITQQQTP